MRNKSWNVLSALIMISMTLLFMANVPKDKEKITIDHLEGDKGAVEFDHATHSEKAKNADGQALKCMDCHHTSKEADKAEDIQACSECHMAAGQEAKKVDDKEAPVLGVKKDESKFDQKKVLYHGLCLDCHKKVEKNAEGNSIKSCKVCHK